MWGLKICVQFWKRQFMFFRNWGGGGGDMSLPSPLGSAPMVGLHRGVHHVWARLLQVRCGLTWLHVLRVDWNVPRLPWFVSRCIIGSVSKHLEDSKIFSQHFYSKWTISLRKKTSTEDCTCIQCHWQEDLCQEKSEIYKYFT